MKRVINFEGCPDSLSVILNDITNDDLSLRYLKEQYDTTLGCEDCWADKPCKKPVKYKLTLTLERQK